MVNFSERTNCPILPRIRSITDAQVSEAKSAKRKADFDRLMLDAAKYHSSGDYIEAVARRLEAYELTSEDSLDRGKAARDVATSYSKLGLVDDADKYAKEAYDIHKSFVELSEIPSTEHMREFRTSAFCRAVNCYREYVEAKNSGINIEPLKSQAIGYIREAWYGLDDGEPYSRPKVSQDDIDMIAGVAAIEARVGDIYTALELGATSIPLAFMSESSKLGAIRTNLDKSEKIKSKKRALFRGIGSLAVGVMSLRKNKKVGLLANKLSLKIV